MYDQIVLSAGSARAEIGLTGCELLSWHVGETSLIWPGDPASWPRSAPVLFPFCGWLNNGQLRVGDAVYAMPVHGFAPNLAFEATQVDAARCVLTLCDTNATRANFPFEFQLTIAITLTNDAIQYALNVRNPAQDLLPYALGLHPGVVVPFDGGTRDQYRLVFDQPEHPAVSVIAPGGLFAPGEATVPMDGRVLDFASAQRKQDSLVMLNARSRGLRLVSPGGAAIAFAGEGFPHWVFWSVPGAPFLCVEAWTGHGDPVGFTGDVFDKPGMIHLPGGEERHHRFSMTHQPAAV